MSLSGKPVLQALRGERVTPAPFWLMRQAGRYLPEYRALRAATGSFLDLCYTPERAAEATLQPLRRFDMDAAIIFSDILLVPQALGQELHFTEGAGPALAPIRSRAAAAVLKLEGLTGRLAPVYRALELVAGSLAPGKTLIGFAGAPWTIATYMVEGGSSRDFSNVKTFASDDPSGFAVLITLLADAVAAHLVAQIEAGAKVVQLFDTWAGIVAAEDFERLVVAPTRRIVDVVKKRFPDTPIIGFPRGIGPLYDRYFCDSGVDALSIDAAISLETAAALQKHGPIQGNLDPQILRAGGKALDDAAHAILAALGEAPFVFNLGHGVLPDTPLEHVARLAALIRQA